MVSKMVMSCLLFRTRRASSVVAFAALLASGCTSSDEPPPQPTPTGVHPPPITGGTLELGPNHEIAVAADPDRDRIWIASVAGRPELLHEVLLEPGDEPGRVVIGTNNQAHVLLRGGRAIVTVDIGSGEIVQRTKVCPAPRGLDVSPTTGAVYGTCANGSVFKLDTATGMIVDELNVELNLRDVVVVDDVIYVSSFLSANVIQLTDDPIAGLQLSPARYEMATGTLGDDVFTPNAAFRLKRLRDGGLGLLHQRAQETPVKIEPGAYKSGACSGAVVHGTLSILDDEVLQNDAPIKVGAYLPISVLNIDFDESPDGEQMAIVAAGTSTVTRLDRAFFESNTLCGPDSYDAAFEEALEKLRGQPIGIRYIDNQRIVVQLRDPPALQILPAQRPSSSSYAPLDLPGDYVTTQGHTLFHTAPEDSILACASCHMEGGDNGHVFQFDPDGPRRTQNLTSVLRTFSAFHWAGDMPTFTALAHDTFTKRMGGPTLTESEITSLLDFVEAIPEVPTGDGGSSAAAQRGSDLFFGLAECNECHTGPALSDGTIRDVGTAGKFRVPPLSGVRLRAPYMHNGCAATLADRFDVECGGATHGNVAALSAAQLDDLVAFLQTL